MRIVLVAADAARKACSWVLARHLGLVVDGIVADLVEEEDTQWLFSELADAAVARPVKKRPFSWPNSSLSSKFSGASPRS